MLDERIFADLADRFADTKTSTVFEHDDEQIRRKNAKDI